MVLQKITRERLNAAASQAARQILEGVAKELKVAGLSQQLLTCQYVGTAEEGSPLQCLTRVKFVWNFWTTRRVWWWENVAQPAPA